MKETRNVSVFYLAYLLRLILIAIDERYTYCRALLGSSKVSDVLMGVIQLEVIFILKSLDIEVPVSQLLQAQFPQSSSHWKIQHPKKSLEVESYWFCALQQNRDS